MEKYFKSKYTIYHYSFDTLYQFLTRIQSVTINRKVFSECCSHTADSKWAGTSSFDEAVKLCQNGWSEDFEKLVSMKKRLDKKLISPIAKPRQVLDIVGYNPSVPDYLIGNPLNMWNRTQKQEPIFVNIYLNLAYSHKTNINSIFNRGVIVQSLVDALECKGYNVRFKTFDCSVNDNEIIFASFNLKGEGEKLNIKKNYFPLCHPSFCRRLSCALIETTPVENLGWRYGYGLPDTSIIKEIIDIESNAIIIPQPSEIGIKGMDIDTDLESFLKYIHLQKFFTKI